jgi:hypothetical protein
LLLEGKATDGQLLVGRFDVSEGEAPPFHMHTREDEVACSRSIPATPPRVRREGRGMFSVERCGVQPR